MRIGFENFKIERRQTMFCRNCGKELIGSPEICINCGAKPMAGTSFCPGCGAPTTPLTEICIKCGAGVAKGLVGDVSPKSRLATTLLAWFLGIFGAHRFYLGKIGTAVAMLLLAIAGWSTIWFFGFGLAFLIAVGIWAFIDFIFAIIGRMKDKEGKVIQKW
jgi:TM2 domain-containing membrane protein YozV